MRTFLLNSAQPAHSLRFWLLGMLASAIAINLTLMWRLNLSVDMLTVQILYWGAALYLTWQKLAATELESDVISTIMGLSLYAWVLLKSASVRTHDDVLFLCVPFISVLGIGLIASGIEKIKQYWKTLLIMFTLCIPHALLIPQIERFIPVNLYTAKLTHVVLWYLGFDVHRQGIHLILPTGAVVVGRGCAGLPPIILLLQIALLFILLFKVPHKTIVFIPVVATLLAFTVNSLRVALLATIAHNPVAFDYWHDGDGSQIFSVIMILGFLLVCNFLTRQKDRLKEDDFENKAY